MIAVANAIGRKDYGYQRSKDLIDAGRKVNLSTGILSCLRNKMKWTKAVERLANLTETNINRRKKLTDTEVRDKAHKAREELKKAQEEDGEIERNGWKD